MVLAARPGDVLAGKFRVERQIGAGGMGSVVEATDSVLGRRVALKIAHPHILEGGAARERFVREARAMAALRGSGFVRVFEVGVLEGGAPFLAMELLQGHDLKSRLRERGPLPLDELTMFVADACEALAEAHSQGLVHRDIKPSNVFVERRPGGREVIRVLDFGISKPKEAEVDTLTASSATLGSPRYMSPEQTLDPHDVDARTDIWSLGVSLYELWTGQLPFDGGTHLRLCKAILEQSPAAPSTHRPDTPPALDALILRCLHKDRTARMPDVAALAEGLAAIAPAASGHARAARALLSAPPSMRVAAAPTDGDTATTGSLAGGGLLASSTPHLAPGLGLDTAAPAIVAALSSRGPAPSRARVAGAIAAIVAIAGTGTIAAWQTSSRESTPTPRVASTYVHERREIVRASTLTRAASEAPDAPSPRRPARRPAAPAPVDDALPSHSH